MKRLIVLTVTAFAMGLLGCGGATSINVGNANQPVNTNPASGNGAAATPSPAVAASADGSPVGSLATPSDAYRTAYALREKKDVAGLKKVMSKDVLEFLTMMGEDEKKSLDEQIAEIFLTPQAKTAEVRNEKIKGDHATVEYLDETGGWKTMDFVKEGSDWKMSLPEKGDLEIETSPPGKKN